MPRVAEGPLTDAEVAAVLSDPTTRKRIEHIREYFIAEAEYYMAQGLEIPGMTGTVIKSLLKGLASEEQSARDKASQERYQSLRGFVQSFRAARTEDPQGGDG